MAERYHSGMRLVLCLLPIVLCVPLAAQDLPPSAPAATPPAASHDALPVAAPVAAPPLATAPLSFSDAAIKRAVHQVLAEDKASARPTGAVLGAERPSELRKFDALVDDAFRPDCWHKDGLKRQPTGWGPFQLGGYVALPFIAVAALRGVCRP